MQGVPAPTAATIFGTWTWSPIVDVLVVAAAAGYLHLVWRAARRGLRWPLLRTMSWLVALTLVIVAVDSALATYSHALFSVHMVVHLLLIMVIPALLVWAEPIRLLRDAAGSGTAAAIDRIRASRAFLIAVSAKFTVPLYSAVLLLTHLTGFQQAMSTHMWIHDSELVLYLVTGYLLLLPLAGDELTVDPKWPFALRFVVLAICVGPDTLVGVTLMMSSTVLAPAYAASRDWGPEALADQNLAGIIMWLGGDGLMMLIMIAVAGQWIRLGDRDTGLGPWLDGIRHRALLGSGALDSDVDHEQAALDAYNARLAHMNGPPPRPRPDARAHGAGRTAVAPPVDPEATAASPRDTPRADREESQ
ncbi:cytochrome c oxidase assembly protein [Nocardia spumae]|uniref:cytochrome c oxidase assembly protein n=1 Tax=Nocardia spumae TaxID=2887190 RepID=UPI001D14366C|nr:cytochrome c oxidase assembly protein [Nocardia spumae]